MVIEGKLFFILLFVVDWRRHKEECNSEYVSVCGCVCVRERDRERRENVQVIE